MVMRAAGTGAGSFWQRIGLTLDSAAGTSSAKEAGPELVSERGGIDRIHFCETPRPRFFNNVLICRGSWTAVLVVLAAR